MRARGWIVLALALLVAGCPKRKPEMAEPPEVVDPTPDPTPDEPEPIRLPEEVEPELELPESDIIFDIPDAPPPQEPTGPVGRAVDRSVEVRYGTNRTRGDRCGRAPRAPAGRCLPNEFYGRADKGALEVGRLTVTIPPTHVAGRVERPRSFLSIQLEREDPDRHVVLARVEPIADHDRWAAEIRDAGRDEALLFVHGYNVSFPAAARQAAQVAYDLDFEGLPLLYSWPSQGTLVGYFTDQEMVRAARPAFHEFLDLVERAGVRRLHILAHSMGNRLVTGVLRELYDAGERELVDQLVLAAPDIDADEFAREFAETLPAMARRMTLYVSNRDKALEASATVHGGGARAGHVDGRLLGHPRLDTVDASSVTTDFLDHSYYAQGESVLADIYCLLEGASTGYRSLLQHQPVGPLGPYFAILAPERSRALDRDPADCDTLWTEAAGQAVPAATPAPTEPESAPRHRLWPWLLALLALLAVAAAVWAWRRRTAP